jgi:hypothetical protein
MPNITSPIPVWYLLSIEDRNAITIQCVNYDRFNAWVIRDSIGQVLPKDGEWEIEPSPSSRSDEFLARTRYATVGTALMRWNTRHLPYTADAITAVKCSACGSGNVERTPRRDIEEYRCQECAQYFLLDRPVKP